MGGILSEVISATAHDGLKIDESTSASDLVVSDNSEGSLDLELVDHILDRSPEVLLREHPSCSYRREESETLTLEFAEGKADKVNEYSFTFTSGSTPTVLTLPSSVQWANELTVEANKRYEVSIVDNIGLWCAVEVNV